MYNEMEYQEEYRMADLIRRQWLGIITAEEQAELEAWSLQEEHARLYAKIRNQAELCGINFGNRLLTFLYENAVSSPVTGW